MSGIQRIVKKINKFRWFPLYNTFYEKLSLKPDTILMESRSGKGLESNIFALLLELQKEPYQKFKVCLSVESKEREAVEEKLKCYDIKVHKILTMGSLPYYLCLAQAKYLVNDTTFPGRFVKKEGQIYLNTWHGTPLKKMGKDNLSEEVLMGNVMRNLLMADYLLFPNEYMQEKMTQAYMLENLYQGEILQEGYPRNAVLCGREDKEKIRRKLGFTKKTYVYMPTFRGRSDQVETENNLQKLREIFRCWEKKLEEGEQILVKLHPFLGQALPLEEYNRIQQFPINYDTNDVLSVCDGLITDYSSVFYDYANTENPIVLFVYDYEDYTSNRGMYEDIKEYPFPVVDKAEAVIEVLHSKKMTDRTTFHKRYNTWDSAHATQRICRHIFLEEMICQTVRLEGNGKHNILVYPGDLDQNGITTVFAGTFDGLNKDKNNYFVSFRMEYLKDYPERLGRIPKGMPIYPMASEMSMDFLTMVAHILYLGLGVKSFFVKKRLKKAYLREWRKHFGFVNFQHVIQYNGYEAYTTMLMGQAPCNKTIWVHNDMVQEIKQKKNQNIHQLKDSYCEYDNVVAVSEDAAQSVRSLAGDTVKLQVIENLLNYQQVREKAQEEIVFGEQTLSTVTVEEIKTILNKPGMKFVNMGRYSKEKGHERLIKAFEEYYKENSESWLIIIGGTGQLYQQTIELASQQESAKHIVLIKTMDNPMPLVAKCDVFLLPSYYEGQPLVLMEADMLGLPVMGCDVSGIQGFMKEYGGTLLEDSQEGILRGMEQATKEKLPLLHINYKEHNEKSRKAIEKLLD